MVLQPRPIACRSAVIGFFALSIVGTIVGLAPDTCCKRALIGTVIIYLATSAAVNTINAILTGAMIASQINKDVPRDSKD